MPEIIKFPGTQQGDLSTSVARQLGGLRISDADLKDIAYALNSTLAFRLARACMERCVHDFYDPND